ncbi:MAG: DUF5916 domain-containing protein, partial [Pyrinomonadaceae bacterium]
ENQGEDYSVDIVMESKGTLTEDGYVVEAAIPFKSLRYEAGKGKFWGIMLLRQISHINNELDTWTHVRQGQSGFLTQAGQITGLEGISTERTLEIIPSLTVSETGKRIRSFPPDPTGRSTVVDNGRFVNKPLHVEPGVTLKYSLTPTITFDAAINPDFAQVEADQTVVTANQRFPIFFEEKRPFFLEGKDYFNTPITVVHTRAIIDPDYAVKLTGKRGRNTFGILAASDNAPGNFNEDEREDLRLCQQRRQINPAVVCDAERFVDKNAFIGILRYKRDVGTENSIGAIATSYDFIERHNKVAGIDGRFRLNKLTVLNFQVLGTSSRRFFYDPNVDQNIYRTGNAMAYTFNYDQDGRHFGWNFDATGYSTNYRADVGFTRRPNNNREGLFMRYKSEPNQKAKIIYWRIFDTVDIQHDWQGRIQMWENEHQLFVQLQHNTDFGIGGDENFEKLYEFEFGPSRNATQSGAFFGAPTRSAYRPNVYGFFDSTISKKYSISAFGIYNWKGAFDFDFGAGPNFPRVSPAALADPNAPLDPGPGKSYNFNATFRYQPTNALQMTFDYTKSWLKRDDTKLVAFDENIFVWRSTYQFTRFIFARGRVDYDTLASNIRGQFLLGYTPNPGTAFYIGYNDDMNRNGFNPISGRLEPGFRRNGRVFFIKMSYLIRKSFGG